MNTFHHSSIHINAQYKNQFVLHSKSTIHKDQQHKQDELTNTVRNILVKLPQTRNNLQNKFINKFSKRSSVFSAIADNAAPDVAQNILRHAHIYEIPKNRIIADRGSEFQNIIVLLTGKFAIVGSPDQPKDQGQKQQSQILKRIIQNSLKVARDLKRRVKQIPLDPNYATQFKTTKATMFDLTIKRYIQNQQQIFNLNALKNCKKYTETLVTCKNSLILAVSSKIFFDSLASYVRKVKSDKISAFRKFQYFNNVQSQRLIQIVDQLPLITLKKNQYIYKQGQQMKEIYLLIKGSIKLTKTVDLFKQNPNNFYLSRQKLGQKKKLPFADFSQVYNYKPRTKLLEIGISNQLAIFGQQQFYCENNLRQVNAQVSSQVAVFYIISISKLEQNLQDKKDFIQQLKQGLYRNQTQKKILYRQQKLSELLICQTKNNMDYFYLQQQSVEELKQQNTPRKYKIQKINSLISPSKSQRFTSTPISQAAFNTFNFDQFPLNLNIRPQRTRKRNQSFAQFDQAQNKIMQLVHTVSKNVDQKMRMKQKSQQIRKRRLNGTVQNKIQINIHNPLFSMDYINKTKKHQSRLARGAKNRILTNTNRGISRDSSRGASRKSGLW